ncbi:hypothetical protein GF351_04545 [Candidatus Woesearchaeota archaeon]|nr:hypothetical protein [Candidatus Woesearchaeota archaeon]
MNKTMLTIQFGLALLLLCAYAATANPDKIKVEDDYITIDIDDERLSDEELENQTGNQEHAAVRAKSGQSRSTGALGTADLDEDENGSNIPPDSKDHGHLQDETDDHDEKDAKSSRRPEEEDTVQGAEAAQFQDSAPGTERTLENSRYMISKEEIAEAGYQGSIRSFARALNRQVTVLKKEIKQKIFEKDITHKVLRQVTQREIASERIDELRSLEIEATDVVETVQIMFIDEADVFDTQVIASEFVDMEEGFLKKMYLAVQHGDYAEKTVIKNQIRDLSKAVQDKRDFAVDMDEDHIRALLRTDASNEDIANSVIS